jgi:hypothetical protein
MDCVVTSAGSVFMLSLLSDARLLNCPSHSLSETTPNRSASIRWNCCNQAMSLPCAFSLPEKRKDSANLC